MCNTCLRLWLFSHRFIYRQMEPSTVKLISSEANSNETFSRLEIPYQRLLELCIETGNLISSCNIANQDISASRLSSTSDHHSCEQTPSHLIFPPQLTCEEDRTIFMELSKVYLNVTNLKFLHQVVKSSQFGQALIKQLEERCDRKGSVSSVIDDSETESSSTNDGAESPQSSTPSSGDLLSSLRTVLLNAQKKCYPAIECGVKEEDLVRSLNIIHNAILYRKLKKKQGKVIHLKNLFCLFPFIWRKKKGFRTDRHRPII